MATTRSTMARLAIFVALFAQLQSALAASGTWTVTEYYAISVTASPIRETCTTDGCVFYTSTDTIQINPKVTPTATPLSTTKSTAGLYEDAVIVTIYVAASDVASTDLITTTTLTPGKYDTGTSWVVPITYTAPASCPTPFTVATWASVDVPYYVSDHLTPTSTSLKATTYTGLTYTSAYTTLFNFLDPSIVPSEVGSSTEFAYSYYVKSCRNPTATGAAYYGPGYRSGGGSSSDDDDDWRVCAVLTGCVRLKTWIIVVASVLPGIFVLGFLESYFWFRRLMLGKSALRLGTVCWCCLSLWVICVTRKSEERSKEDQVLLKDYWATLGAGTRIKLWFKWGFRWKYPVELLGDPKGNNPVVFVAAPAPAPGVGPDGGAAPGGTGGEKMGMQVDAQQQQQQQQQGVPMPMFVPGQPGQQAYVVPYPAGAVPPPGFVPQPGYMMPVPPQSAYVAGQPGAPVDPQQQQQQVYPGYYAPTPSPVQTSTTGTEVPPVQPTPPPGYPHQQPPPGLQPPQQPH